MRGVPSVNANELNKRDYRVLLLCKGCKSESVGFKCEV